MTGARPSGGRALVSWQSRIPLLGYTARMRVADALDGRLEPRVNTTRAVSSPGGTTSIRYRRDGKE